MASALISSGGAASAIVPEIWSARLQDNLRNSVAFNSLVSRDYEGEIRGMGDTIRIPSMTDVTAVDLAEGAIADAVAPSTSTTSLVINKRSVVDFEITDQAQLQSIPFMEALQERAIAAITLKMQSNIIADIAPSTSSPDHTIAYDSGTTLADADLLEALDLEKAANWPDTGRHIVTGGAQYNDLLNVAKFYDNTLGGVASVGSGGVTNIYGHSIGWTGAASTTTYLFHESFLQMAVQRELTMNLYDQGGQGKRSFRLNIDVLYGVKQVHSNRVITIS